MSQAAAQTGGSRRIANRYEVHELLGRGGMACVYRATDLALGREVALKEMQLGDATAERSGITVLFEREFHTLSQLSHPRVISVYDYGLSEHGPYYTMELLDGGDLRDRTPVPWPTACALLFDVCSSLALLHSRRLLHRDISPRNIRCTRDGKAKLIDFGAMTSMGSDAQIVGTPAFTAPETVHRLAIDGRTDLFSLGATLYNALTGHMPYPARTFGEALAAWNSKPVPPSARVRSIPAALDDLVLSMINIEPALRPQTAFDVMQRLAAIAGLTGVESAEVSAAYLATPTLVGRESVLDTVRERLTAARRSRGGAVLIRAESGLGRSRVLDACLFEAKKQGVTVARTPASGESEPFAVARALIEHLLTSLPSGGLVEAYPELFSPSARANDDDGQMARLDVLRKTEVSSDPSRVEQAVVRFILTVSRTQPLVIAVDDLHRIDPASAAVLAVLIDKNRRANVFVLFTADGNEEARSLAISVLARRCTSVRLAPLSHEQTRELLSSVFGEVAHLDLLTDEIHQVALGSPRAVVDLAQHLVDRKLIRYTAGNWTLPHALSAADLPRNVGGALRAKIAGLSPVARFLAQAQALAYHDRFSSEDYRALRPGKDPLETDHAVSELLTTGALTKAGSSYVLANRLWNAALQAGLDAELERQLHSALAKRYSEPTSLARIHHLFAAGEDEPGLEAFSTRHEMYRTGAFDRTVVFDEYLTKLVPTYQDAMRASIRLKHSPRSLNDMRRWALALSTATEGQGYWETAPAWLAQLRHDSGLDLWQADTAGGTPAMRITRALQAAHARFLATPEAERVYAVDEAIRLLAEYVVISIATGARSLDSELLASLPALLEPFAVLSPVLDAIWQNSIATIDSLGERRPELARERWITVLAKLDAVTGTEHEHIGRIRSAVAYGIGLMEAQIGLASASQYADRLDKDPQQKLSAVHLRKIARLEQGDWKGADRLRREAELMSLQLRTMQMFKSLAQVEFTLYAMAGDLTGMRQVIEELRVLAAHSALWELVTRDAEAWFDLIRGDPAAALAGFDECLSRITFREDGLCNSLQVWMGSKEGRAEALIALDRLGEARDTARDALRVCSERGITGSAAGLVRALASAEGRLGDHAAAAARLDELIRTQTEGGVSGVRLGLSFEARARIAIWADDSNAYAENSKLAAREYRRGAGSPLGVRYERLVNEALRAGFRATANLADFEPSTMFDTSQTELPDIHTAVLRAMAGAGQVGERAKRALRLVCEARAASGGHLYLVDGTRATLGASFGAVAAPSELRERVQTYLTDELSRADTMTEIATSPAFMEVVTPPNITAGDTQYELMLLTCVIDGEGVVTGVVALVEGEKRVQFARQTQLLSTLAGHLLRSAE